MSEPRGADHDLMVRAAWLYYVHGKGQEEVARNLKVSRFKVTRLLAQAREAGIVKISIQHETGETLALGDWLAARYGLTECVLTPYFEDEVASLADEAADRLARRSVAIAAANYLNRCLQQAGPLTVGLGSGRTMTALADAFDPAPKSDARFVSIVGSLTRHATASTFEVVQRMAQACGGEGHFLPAPFVTDTEADHVVIMNQQMVRDALALARRADLYVVSFGECTPEAYLFKHRLAAAADLTEARAAGAVCDMAGKFFDADGRLADCSLNRRTAGVALDDLDGRELVVLAAGRGKVAALRALLKTGLVDRLIVDGELANRLIG